MKFKSSQICAVLTCAAAACAGAAIAVPPPPLVPGDGDNEYVYASYPSLAYEVVDDGAVTILAVDPEATLEVQSYALLEDETHVLDGHPLVAGDVVADGALRNIGTGSVLVLTAGGELHEILAKQNLVVDLQDVEACDWERRCVCDCDDEVAIIVPPGTPNQQSCDTLNGQQCHDGSEFFELANCTLAYVRVCDDDVVEPE